jgi:nitronate monooxygenase
MMATKECPIHDNLKQALCQATETDTTIAMRTIRNPHRLWRNKAVEKVLELESQKAPLQEIIQVASGENARKMYYEGDLDIGIVSCGQGVGLVKDIPTVKELLDRLMKEAENVIQKLKERSL